MKPRLRARSLAALLTIVLAGCAAAGKGSANREAPSAAERRAMVRTLVEEGAIPGDSRQILLVAGGGSSVSAVVAGYEKKDGRWAEVLPPIRSVAGRGGFAPAGEKREGDGRTPSGVFPLRRAFGYAPESPTRLLYRQATEEDLWVDDAASPDYNRWVKRGETSAASFEKMRREDDLYKYGIVIEYNTLPVVKGHGSAIFLHLWKGEGEPTAGCVAMAGEDLLKVLKWLDPEKKPVAAMGTEETLRDAIPSRGKQL